MKSTITAFIHDKLEYDEEHNYRIAEEDKTSRSLTPRHAHRNTVSDNSRINWSIAQDSAVNQFLITDRFSSDNAPLKVNVLGRWLMDKFMVLLFNTLVYSLDVPLKVTFAPKWLITKVTWMNLDALMYIDNVTLEVNLLSKWFITKVTWMILDALVYSNDVFLKVTLEPKWFIANVTRVVLDTLVYSGDVPP